ncbi:14501_t:CDS:10 [Racocetra persica]|uniref:14501_t:CDS:1 n=1 Tax=Racocetra persica TaxID=160502 RepID=A0ACA9K9D1_9GLOM|nr:14501_t:CDS:10 [Racocetra persica]
MVVPGLTNNIFRKLWVFDIISVAEEYIGAILGSPLPAYQSYNPDLMPGVDTFFSTVTFRYGHSELSDFYRIQDEYGDTLYNLALNNIKNLTLLESLGLERVLWSMILQRQEEVDVFFADSTKNINAPDHHTYDLAAFDVLRSRDRGIPLYNVVRQYFGFPSAQSFADISSNPTIQANLAKIYPNGIETVEAWVGVMSEDHLNGSNFGKVMNASMVMQKPNMFTAEERKIIRNTTLRNIITRNINPNVTFPQNIWAVQPQIKLNSSDDNNYPSKINVWTQYIISYRGFGPDDDGMKGAEFIIGIVTNGNVTLGNYHADVGGYHPPLRDSNQDPTLVPKFSMSDSKAVTVEFKRLLNPPGKKPIIHGDMKCGILKFLFFVTFIHHNQHLKIHRFIQLLGGISVSTFGAAAISTMVTTQTPHAWLGLFIYTLAFIELGLGIIALWGQMSVVSVNKELTLIASLMASKYDTSNITFYVFIIADFEIFIAISDSLGWKIAYCCWILVILCAFLIGELWWHFEEFDNKFFRIKKDETNAEKKTMMHAHINHQDYIKLPEFTWEEINERVQRGAQLVVCDGLVIDIHTWCDSHPGGSQILLQVIGTDITNDFYNTHKNEEIVEDIDSPKALLIPKDTPSGNQSSALAKYVTHLQGKSAPQKRLSAAQFIDNINTKFYLRKPLAQHTHSRFATQKMATLVIGKMSEKISEKGLLVPSNESIYQNPENDSVEIDKALISAPKITKFHRYKLTSKKMVNTNVKYPVIRFTFSKVHQGAKDVSTEKFLPGHYIEVQSRVNCQILIRSYTPLEGSLSKSFSIYVKIYPKGLFSQHLNNQLIGYEIQARGPFDVSDRQRSYVAPTVTVTSPYVAPTLTNPLSQGTNILLPTRPSAKFTETKTTLLNPDSPDGCWDELYMIAGGTGITPMLQLIKYYLERSIKQKDQYISYKRMHLLFGNRKIEDVIDGILLEDLSLSSRGQLTVTYCLSEPPSDWEGLRGRINQKIIHDWINIMKGVLLESNNAQLIAENNNYRSILQSHSVRHGANEPSVSPLPIISPQSPPPMQPQSHDDYRDDSTIYTGPRPGSQASRKFRSSKNIDIDLANCGRGDDLIQGKIVVCGPPDILLLYGFDVNI